MLFLHIGLPKTGTTFLQHQIFKPARGLRFLNRRRAPRLAGDLRTLGRTNAVAALFYRRRIVAALAARVRGRAAARLIVSEENISVRPADFWAGAGSGPGRLAGALATLAGELEPPLAPLRVLIGIRRQDQWLASRYAESSKHFAGFGQADFDRRMAAIAAAPGLAGPLGWLDYDAVHRSFAAALGAENVLLVPLERLALEPRAAFAEMGRFMGGLDLLRRYEAAAAAGALRRNRLAEGENLWRLRRDGGPLRLDPPLQAALRARFAASNRALAGRLPLGFEP